MNFIDDDSLTPSDNLNRWILPADHDGLLRGKNTLESNNELGSMLYSLGCDSLLVSGSNNGILCSADSNDISLEEPNGVSGVKAVVTRLGSINCIIREIDTQK